MRPAFIVSRSLFRAGGRCSRTPGGVFFLISVDHSPIVALSFFFGELWLKLCAARWVPNPTPHLTVATRLTANAEPTLGPPYCVKY